MALYAFVTESDDQRHCICCLADRVLAIVLDVVNLVQNWRTNEHHHQEIVRISTMDDIG